MRAEPRTGLALAFTVVLAAVFTAGAPSVANAGRPRTSQERLLLRGGVPPRIPLKGPGAKIAVQPFDGPNSEPLRGLVARIVRDRGFLPMTTLPKYEGTGQYPILARDHRLAGFVTADMEERGRWQSITFLVWNGSSGSIAGRWTVSGSPANLTKAIGRGFWAHLGAAIRRVQAPRTADDMRPAAPMRIDASDDANRDLRHFAEGR